MTFAEIRFGIELAPDPFRRAALNDWLTHRLRPMFEGRVLSISEDVMLKWRLLVEDGRKAGYTFSQPDLNIAATGLHHGLTVVTRDTGDYARARVPVFNPWVDPLPRQPAGRLRTVGRGSQEDRGRELHGRTFDEMPQISA